jgi:hypothetical protein
LYERFAGRAPVAFRAGCFAANHVTLRCLRRAGLHLDSSFNPCYRSWSFTGEALQPNQVRQIEGIWEIPITVAKTPLPEGYHGLKHADPCALSFTELRAMLEHAAAARQRHFVIVFHSFSSVKAADSTFGRMKPDRLTIARLDRLLAYLSSRPDLYCVSTFGDLARGAVDGDTADDPLTELPVLAAISRKSMQALNRFYWI